MPTKEKQKVGIMDAPTFVTARRALGITKTYIALAVIMSVLAIAVWGNVMYTNISTNSASNSTTSNTLVSNIIAQQCRTCWQEFKSKFRIAFAGRAA